MQKLRGSDGDLTPATGDNKSKGVTSPAPKPTAATGVTAGSSSRRKSTPVRSKVSNLDSDSVVYADCDVDDSGELINQNKKSDTTAKKRSKK